MNRTRTLRRILFMSASALAALFVSLTVTGSEAGPASPRPFAACVQPPGPSGTRAARAPVSTARFALAAAEVNGTLYTLGGTFGFCDGQTTLEAYDATTNTWTPRAPMPTGRYHLGAAALGGKLYAVGGWTGTTRFTSVEAFTPNGMVAWWPGDNDAQDIVGGNHGTLQNGAAFAPGMVARAFSLDGVDDYVSAPGVGALTIAGPFTVDFWFKPNATHSPSSPNAPVLFGKGSANSIGFANNDGRLEVRGPFPRPTSTTDVWLAGSRYHVAVTFDSTAYRVYVNGAQEGNTAPSGYSILDNTEPITLGKISLNATAFGGLLDEVEVFNRALTQSEIQSIYDAGMLGKCKTTVTNRAPTADAGADLTFECAGAQTTVTLDGSASSDPDGDTPLAYSWGEGATQLGTGATLNVNLGGGPHTVTLTVTDPGGLSSTDTVLVNVSDDTPPVIAGASVQEILLDFDDGLLPTAHGWVFSNFDQPISESQVGSVSGGVLHFDSRTLAGDPAVYWRRATTGINVSNYDYEIRMRAVAPDSTRTCFGGLLGAGIEVRESFDTDFTLMKPQLHLGGIVGHCFIAAADGDAFHTYRVEVRNDTQATLYVDGAQLGQFTAERANTLPLEISFGDITSSGGNAAAEIDFVRVASAASPLADVHAAADADSCSAVVNVTAPAATDNCGGVTVAGARSDGEPLTAPYPVGTTVITWTATDAHGNTSSATQTVTVRDAQGPSITGLAVSPASLWPPNHSMQNVTVGYDAADGCGAVNCVVASVASNEPVNGTGDGDASPDWLILDAHHVQLRAERAGAGTGRVYKITVACTDSSGNTTTKTVAVTVPKSQGK